MSPNAMENVTDVNTMSLEGCGEILKTKRFECTCQVPQ